SAVSAILARPMLSVPGSHYRYMDDDYELLAAIVEAASGRSWESYIRRELLSKIPLGHTTFWPTGDWAHKGANGMASTVDDLLRWTIAIEQGQVLSDQDARDLRSGQVYVRTERGEDVYYGYGVRVYEGGGQTLEVMHSGSSDDNNNVIARVLADGTTVIVMSSAGNHAGTTWSSYLARKLPIGFRAVH
ncbi:MAG: serine hydrolase domain-containing protein, partial [Gemmatimonadaceae bacterium]